MTINMTPYRTYFTPGCVSEYMRNKQCPFRQKPYQIDTHEELVIDDNDYAVTERRCRAPPIDTLIRNICF